MEAAMMVMVDSAVPRMRSCVVASVKSELPMPGRVVIFTMEVMPALFDWVRGPAVMYKQGDGVAYNIPMLMAISTPIFSFLFMVRDQMILHGSMARIMSIAPA